MPLLQLYQYFQHEILLQDLGLFLQMLYELQIGLPAMQPNFTNLSIAPTGEVTAYTQDGQSEALGNVELSRFPNPQGLKNIGRNIYIETAASGPPEAGQPGQDGFGQLAQGYLEMSNVKVVEEMVNLIKAQRAYEVNSKAISAVDSMLRILNNNL